MKPATRDPWRARQNVRIKGKYPATYPGRSRSAARRCVLTLGTDLSIAQSTPIEQVDCANDRVGWGLGGAQRDMGGPHEEEGGAAVELRARSGESGRGVALGTVSGVTASAVDRGGCRVSS